MCHLIRVETAVLHFLPASLAIDQFCYSNCFVASNTAKGSMFRRKSDRQSEYCGYMSMHRYHVILNYNERKCNTNYKNLKKASDHI